MNSIEFCIKAVTKGLKYIESAPTESKLLSLSKSVFNATESATKKAKIGEQVSGIDKVSSNGVTPTTTKFRIGIIDIFGKNKGIPINGTKNDFTHGDMTSAVLESLTKDLDVTITRIPVKQRKVEALVTRKNPVILLKTDTNTFDLKSLLKQLKKINTNGEYYDYLNISGSLPVEYSLFGLSEGGTELSQKEILEMVRKQAKRLTYNDGKLKFLEQGEGRVLHIIEELERIAGDDTQIFLSSCNKKNKFNVFSLAKGVHTVGACDGVTKLPLKRFADYPLVSMHENLPVYITDTKEIINESTKTAVSLKGIIPINSELSKLSKKELLKKVATKTDYVKLKSIVDKLYATGKFKFDIDFMRFKLVSSVDKTMRDKIYDLKIFQEIFAGKFDEELLKYTTPAGTHCDLMFRQFFDMHSKTKHVISMHKTTKIPNTCSGTSFAAPQGLCESLKARLE